MTWIETATTCSCGTPVSVTLAGDCWQAICQQCYDPTEDAGSGSSISGDGQSPEEALWAWQDAHDEHYEVDWVPESDVIGNLSRDVSVESQRQSGWTLVAAYEEEARRADAPCDPDLLQAWPRLYCPVDKAAPTYQRLAELGRHDAEASR